MTPPNAEVAGEVRDPGSVRSAYIFAAAHIQYAWHSGRRNMSPDMAAEVADIIALLNAAGDYAGKQPPALRLVEEGGES